MLRMQSLKSTDDNVELTESLYTSTELHIASMGIFFFLTTLSQIFV
jgi:hypothetical protein